jgi:thiamine phosphate synthase YjbQ (UPF0047 family)
MVVTREISLQTKGQTDIIDITSPVAEQVAGAGVKNGTVTLFLVGSTAGITTIESEPGVLSDFRSMWERTIPQTLPTNTTATVRVMATPTSVLPCLAPHWQYPSVTEK